MNYIKKMARGCCCKGQPLTTQELVDLVANKLNELTGDPDNPLTLLAAVDLVASKLDELVEPQSSDDESVEYATDSDIIDLFNN